MYTNWVYNSATVSLVINCKVQMFINSLKLITWVSQVITCKAKDWKIYKLVSLVSNCKYQNNTQCIRFPITFNDSTICDPKITGANPSQSTVLTLWKPSLEDPKVENPCKSSNFKKRGKNSERWKVCVFVPKGLISTNGK